MSLDLEERRRAIRVKAGHQLLERVMKAKADGLIKDYMVVCYDNEPEVIAHIRLIK